MAEWKIAERKFDNIIDQLLYNRGVFKEKDEALEKLFFNPNFDKDLGDPFLLTGMKKAVERIQTAVKNNETVGIFADYDADGIPAAALLFRAFKKISLKSKIYIPNRESGYGLSREGIDYLISEKCTLIITADLGIRSSNEAKYCNEKSIDLIITDHHIPGEEIPKALAVVNPKIKGNKYPFKELCGCGVAFKLIQALGSIYSKELNESFLKWNLDLVAISTIADVVPLIGENRVFANFGLLVLKKTKNTGLSELIKQSGIKQSDIAAYTVGFQIAPRINAPGRIDHATKSFELLITEDRNEARELAIWLNKKNEDRQWAMVKVEKSAVAKIEENHLYKNKIIVVVGEWLKGVIGPSASHLVEKYSRPVILFSKEEGAYVGSARSVEGVNIVEIFESIKDSIKKFGGHKGAAGLTVTNIEKFVKSIVLFANNHIKDEFLVKSIRVDGEIEPSEVTKSLCQTMSKFEPFGMGNPKPVFLARKVELSALKAIGENKNHLSFQTKYGNNTYRSVFFNFANRNENIKVNTLYDIVFCLEINHWNGTSNLNFNLIDIKESK
ncbi:MAG: single-stranded-DNA-specific exonuclease RecJ [Patescibacteria group bacterium]|nr:single-stranded-DNA-specific exonuclease RecJ [Patescibacteria group bacterium]